MRAVVVALGKIGLPIAAKIASAGHHVVGCDVNPRTADLVNAGQAPFSGESGLQATLEEVVADGRLRATTETTAAVRGGADLVIAVPPLMVDAAKRPDYRILDSVVADIGDGLQSGTVVSVETTLPVGTTRGRLAPLLAERSGLAPEQDFFAVHSPERVYSGRIFSDLDMYPKLVGGVSPEGERRAAELYRTFISAEVRAMGCVEAAELTKLAETTYRDVNIALANEFARYADRIGVDVQRVIDAANTQPFSHIHQPGIAVGGHCIPVYPRFYLAGHPDATIPAAARELNESMPAYGVDLLSGTLGGELAGRRILLLGITYRGNVKETAYSGAFDLRDELEQRGAVVAASDPLHEDFELEAHGFTPWDGTPVDAAIVQADHAAFRELTPDDVAGVSVVLDGRGVLDSQAWESRGIRVLRVGQTRVVTPGLQVV